MFNLLSITVIVLQPSPMTMLVKLTPRLLLMLDANCAQILAARGPGQA